jgi:hypothetical protein
MLNYYTAMLRVRAMPRRAAREDLFRAGPRRSAARDSGVQIGDQRVDRRVEFDQREEALIAQLRHWRGSEKWWKAYLELVQRSRFTDRLTLPNRLSPAEIARLGDAGDTAHRLSALRT